MPAVWSRPSAIILLASIGGLSGGLLGYGLFAGAGADVPLLMTLILAFLGAWVAMALALALREWTLSDEAMSPVTGTLLLVVVTVLLAAIVYVVVVTLLGVWP